MIGCPSRRAFFKGILAFFLLELRLLVARQLLPTTAACSIEHLTAPSGDGDPGFTLGGSPAVGLTSDHERHEEEQT